MRTPASTYRLQLTSSFTLFDAAEVVPYLADLGVDWVYLSPILEAEEGSEHGYDVLRHDRVDPARGGAEGLAALSAAAREHGLGVLVDIVPNHVGVASPVPGTWWWDVLQHGASSRYASWFDVDWEAGGGKVLWPVVGDDDAGSIEVDTAEGVVRYHDFTLPMAPGTSTLEEQHYELASWRRADSDLNYRRFFTVKELAGIRVELPDNDQIGGAGLTADECFRQIRSGPPLARQFRLAEQRAEIVLGDRIVKADAGQPGLEPEGEINGDLGTPIAGG